MRLPLDEALTILYVTLQSLGKRRKSVKQFSNLLKKLRLRQILTIFLVGVALFINTACNSGDVRGARPNNPPVQAGGANNPHKGGGDGYTQYKTSTDPRANTSSISGDRDVATLPSEQLIATARNSDLLYPMQANPTRN